MKRYAEYKDSRIPCIGEIPGNWATSKLKYVFRKERNAIKVGPFGSQIKGEDFRDEGFKVYNQRSVLDNDFNLGDSFIDKKKFNELIAFKLNPHDVLITTRGTIGKIAIAPDQVDDGIIHPCIIKFSIDNNKIQEVFLKYVFNDTQITLEQLILASNATTIPVVYSEPLKNIFIPLPEIDKQKSITDYLDSKTAAIDALVADKQKLIDLLKEKRQAIISESVTKGLDKNAKMKDSGIEWIGEIPEGWSIAKIKFNTYVKGRIGWQGLKSDEFIDDGAYLITGTDIIDGHVNWDTCYHISNERYDEAPQIQLKDGDLIITKDGTIGKVAVVENMPDKSILNSGLFVIRPLYSQYLSNYMYWLLNSKCFQEYVGYLETGSTIKHLYQETFENFSYPTPSVHEQETIVEYIKDQVGKVDSIMFDIQTQIEKLKEYRQSIISEAVTGKVMIAGDDVIQTPLAKQTAVFKRLVLSAYILDNICDEPTAGRIKLEKLLYLSEHCAEIPLHSEFQRYAAGPYDPKSLYSIEEQLRKNKWFGRNTDKSDSKAYMRMSKSNGYKQYLDANFNPFQKSVIDKLINQFKTARTTQCEIIATLYGAWNDFIISGVQPTDEQIVNEVLTNWHERKERIERNRWITALIWMKEKNIIPVGYGSSTKGGRS